MKKDKILEWSGVITAIIYSLLVAMNIGAEFLVFIIINIAILIGLWALLESTMEFYFYNYFMQVQVSWG